MDNIEAESESNTEGKVAAIFRELAGERGESLCDYRHMSSVTTAIADALRHESTMSLERAQDIGFHLSDWHTDAAFIVALHLFPERFTPAEIEDGVRGFLVHAPNHVAAASALFGYPVEDIFEVGALDGPGDSEVSE